MHDTIQKAKDFARVAHDSIKQVRKYTGEPYWTHTYSVASIIQGIPWATENMVIAALLHDIAEDVQPVNPFYGLELIQDLFGHDVRDMVFQLTDVFTKENYPDKNRKWRKAREANRLALISRESATIKLADLIDNTADIVANNKNFARIYLAEKADMLPKLQHGDSALWKRAEAQLEKNFSSL